jgi:hypothetical protein
MSIVWKGAWAAPLHGSWSPARATTLDRKTAPGKLKASWWGVPAAIAALALAMSGCTASVSTTPTFSEATGAAIMDWTIQGAKDPAACNATGASTFHVSLFGSGGGFAGEFVQDCTAFATTIGGLAPDTYTGQAELLDSGGRARTTSVNLAAFSIVGGGDTSVALDFPVNSFL